MKENTSFVYIVSKDFSFNCVTLVTVQNGHHVSVRTNSARLKENFLPFSLFHYFVLRG